MRGVGDALGILALFVGGGLLLSVPQIFILLALREIRKMAATLPEKDRERWLNDSLASTAKALKS